MTMNARLIRYSSRPLRRAGIFHRRPHASARTAIILAGSIAALFGASSAPAATKTFDGNGGGGSALDTVANWNPDGIPVSTDEVLLDNSSFTLPTQLTTTGNSPTYGDLIWNNNATSTITINTSNATSQVITLSGAPTATTAAVGAGGVAGDLLIMGSTAATNTLTIGGNAGAGNGRLNLAISKAGNFDVVSAGATLNLTAAVGGTFAITKTGAGTLVLAGANTFGDTGLVFTISTGAVRVTGNGTLGSKFGDLAVNASLDLSDTNQTVDALSGTVSGSIFNNGSGTSTLTVGNDFGSGTFNGVISNNTNAGTGVVALTKVSTGTATFTAAQTYSGATTVNLGYLGNTAGAGALTLSNSAARLANSAVTLNGTTFTTASNSGTTSTRASSLTLNNAILTTAGNSTVSSVDAITGALSLGAGRSTISVTPAGGRNELLTAGSLTRNLGATALIRGSNLGLNPLANAAASASNISFGTAPTLSGSGTAGTTTVGILPWAYGDTTNTGNGTDFLTYETTNGLRRLTSSEYVTTFASGNATLDNAKITSAIGEINASTSLNSLTLGAAGRVNGTGTLNIASGGVLAVDNSSIGTLTAGTVSLGSAEGVLLAVAGKTLTVASVVAGSGGLTAGGAGTVVLTASNTYTGGTYLSGGVLNINGDAALGTAPANPATDLTFSGGTLQAGASGISLGSTRNLTTAVTALNAFFDTNGFGANALSVAGTISGPGGINKIGSGTLTLSGANTYTGPTNVTAGTLKMTGTSSGTSSLVLLGGEAKLDFSAATAPAINIVASTASLAFNNGAQNIAGVNTVTIQGKDNAASAQTFAGTSFANFASHLNLTPGSGTGTLTVNLGALSRTTLSTNISNKFNPVGATLDITIPAGVTVPATATLVGSSPYGIIVGATVNASSWATLSSGNVIGTSGYNSSFTTAGVNLDVTASGNLTVDLNTIRFNTPAATTVTLAGATGVRAVTGGGILVTSAVGANLSRITSGALQGISRRDIIFIQNNTAGDLQVDSVITDLGGQSAQGIAKSGPGKLIVTAPNTYNGGSVINEGTIVVTGDAAAPLNKTGSITSGANVITGLSDTTGVFIGQKVNQATALPVSSSSTTWVVTAFDSTTVTLSNNATGTVASGSTFNFSAAGGLGIGSGSTNSVAPGATLQIGNNGATGSLFAGQNISVNGSLIFNHSNAFTYGAAAEVISGIGSVTQAGANTLTLSGTNTYTGATTVSNLSTLIAGSTSAFGANSATTVAAGGTLQFAGRSVSLGSLAGGGTVENANAAPATLTVGGDNTSTTFSGTLRDGTGGGALIVTKTGTGTLSLSGSNLFTGNLAVNSGVVSIAGGFTAPILVGGGSNTTGVLNILPGAAINANVTSLLPSITPGAGSGSVGAVYQTGGAVTFSGQLLLAGGLGASGFYSLSSGSVTDVGGTGGSNERFRVGGAGINANAAFYQSGGTINLLSGAPNLEVGANSGGGVTNSTGVAYFTGGTFTGVTNARIGYDGTTGSVRGEMTVAGTAAVAFTGTTTLGQTAGDVGILNLNGGTYTTKQIVKGSFGTGRVNFNGGTLKAATAATGATFFTGLSSATIFSGNATIDTNGQTITINQPLLAPSGSGVTVIPVANGGAGYVGAPVISFTGGGGTGATAVANMADDGTGNGTLKIASITVTNPGTDYTSAPTVAVSGGGGTGALLDPATVAANVSGGLTKAGAGTLNLSGANSYTGPTNVSEGTLQIAGTISAGSAISVSSGTLVLSNATTPINTATALTLGDTANGTSGMVQLGNNLSNITETFGTLTLSGDSTLDFGSGTGGQDLIFSGIARTGGAKLFILGWSGTANTQGTTSNDRLLFSTGDSSAFTSLFPSQADVSFNGNAGYSAIDFGNGGGFEIVAVPEPASTALIGAAGLLGLIGLRERRTAKKLRG